ncbi:nitroreductase family protein [Parapedobacter koreensis]|uniref:Putative NAD(P)H nitroreductase n=1 Tax=Parapedobacter koreensis TaxID=332977 RepID=A0A1H7RM53_9SPHI|nr:nitroreductase [Parapedobacter koreensis]SEL60447.1 Nitroreductase [Parapedobacter koreensis]
MNDFQTIQHIMQHRRSIFPVSYTKKEITKDTLIQLLECANTAPTHKLTQPWRFVVFREEGLTRLANQLADLYKALTPAEQFLQKKYENTREKILQSGAVIAIVASYSGAVPQWEELAATACAVQNLWLAASAAGIGGYWSSPGAIKHVGDFLALAGNEECLGFFYMGYHDEPPRTGNRKPVTEKISWED